MSEAHPMTSGDGAYSYKKNSSLLGKVIDKAKEIIKETIAEKLDIQNFPTSSGIFSIADLGCSVGPNTFYAVQNIIDSIMLKYATQHLEHQIPEFHVFFNDHISNDFNMLFASLPPHRKYFAAGVPGSFYTCIFPKSSLHFVHSSYSIQWLSKVPQEILDKTSPAWNKGRIHYSNSPEEVVQAYSTRFAKDMESFLDCRAHEMVCGGFMALIVPGRSHKTLHSQVFTCLVFELLGSCLLEMAKNSIITEEKVDSFNIPVYIPSLQELELAINKNGCFSMERIENLPQDKAQNNPCRAKLTSSFLRAGMEGLFKGHFGEEIIDDLFDNLRKKCEESSIYEIGHATNTFVVIKRK